MAGFCFFKLFSATLLRMQKKPKIICIIGATATGKTSLSITLAKQYNGEIISADSRQVYKKLDIGTAKITPEEMNGIPHHLLSIIEPTEIYTGHDFLHDADEKIVDITARKKTPFIVGGTLFYIQLLLRTMSPSPVPPNPQLRAKLATHTTTELHQLLKVKNPAMAKNIDSKNYRRLIRALEIQDALGYIPKTTSAPCPYNYLLLALDCPKETLRARYEDRATQWLKAGLLEEVSGLLASGISLSRLKEFGFEYTLAYDLLKNTINKDEFIQKFIEKNWQYAKRQNTWLKKMNCTWIDGLDTEIASKHVEKFLATKS